MLHIKVSPLHCGVASVSALDKLVAASERIFSFLAEAHSLQLVLPKQLLIAAVPEKFSMRMSAAFAKTK